MGFDRYRGTATGLVSTSLLDMVNAEFALPPTRAHLAFHFRQHGHTPKMIGQFTEVDFWVKEEFWKTSELAFFRVRLNFRPPGQRNSMTVVECNPNKFKDRYAGFVRLLQVAFGDRWGEVRNSRIDVNADIPNVSVLFYRERVRAPRKRKTSECGHFMQTFSSAGVQTFNIGRSPDQWRFYDKISELKSKGVDVRFLPSVLTRIEREMQYRRCPFRSVQEIHKLKDYRPFDTLQFLNIPVLAEHRRLLDPADFFRQYSLNRAVKDFSMQEAARLINCGSVHKRQFWRDFGKFVEIDQGAIRAELQAAYASTIGRFFNNECSDVRATYRTDPSSAILA